MSEVNLKLDELFRIHSTCVEMDHGVRLNNSRWIPFTASRFVYGFFVFNSIYSVNWDETLKNAPSQGIVTEHDMVRERDKITSFAQVCARRCLPCDVEYFRRRASTYVHSWTDRDMRQALAMLENGITQDPRTCAYRGPFLRAFRRLIEAPEGIQADSMGDTLRDLLLFIYMVRNNTFHGSKTLDELMSSEQTLRLSTYAAILCAIHDLFFRILQRHTNWRPPVERLLIGRTIDSLCRLPATGSLAQGDRVILTNRRSTPSHPPGSCFSSHQQTGIPVPEGILFYPCCGDDIHDPINLFFDTISEFHFVDIQAIPGQVSRRARSPNGMPWRGLVPPILVREYHLEIDDSALVHIFVLSEPPGRVVKVYCHKDDGERVFNRLERISIFFYRGDSPGEGGSGVWWLGPRLFNEVICKLENGGLIVTDGSNPDPRALDVPWSPLWQHVDRSRGRHENEVMSFAYGGRLFERVAEIASRRVGVYVWKATQLSTS